MPFAKIDGAQAAIARSLRHVAHRVDDVQKVVKFYTEVLGFRVFDWIGDFFAFLRCGRSSHRQFRLRRQAAAPSHCV
jgi:catechol 2,3-dioxygenase-like lactoylglutathione lyase family enzyme